jgi:hypothetical protein
MSLRAAAKALLLLAVAGTALPQPCSAGPWEPPGWRREAPREAAKPSSPASLPFQWALHFYRHTISTVDGDRCPSHPSCSAYAVEAFSRHGPLLGAILTAGRLQSEADQAAFSPKVYVDGRSKVFAPVADDLAFLRGALAP